MWLKVVYADTPNRFEVKTLAGEIIYETASLAEFEAFCAANAAQFDEEPAPEL